MIDWKALQLQENHGNTIQPPLLKHFPLKKKSYQPMYKNSYTKDVNQQAGNLLALKSLVYK